MASEIELALGTVLPWVGGFTGATLLYFCAVVWLNWRQEKRLQRIERELGVLHGMLLVLSDSPQLRKERGRRHG